MTESTKEKTPLGRRIWRIWQWALATPILLAALFAALGLGDELAAEGAPVTTYFASAAVLMGVGLLLTPPAFFRLPRAAKVGSYLAIPVGLGFWAAMLGQVQAAYEQTPEGAKLAEERRIQWEAEKEAERRAKLIEDKRGESERLVAAAEAEGAKLEEIMEQQEDCLSWRGQLTDLNDHVRDSLHNPSSFEHIETMFIVPDDERYNVLLKFRAENGFGALRSAYVRASMVPETCEILKVTEPQPL